jgi:hypothetical protein
VKERLKEEEKLQKADSKKERERVKAKKAVEHGRQKEAKEAQNNKNALQKSSKNKRKSLRPSQSKTKRQKCLGGSVGSAEPASPTQATPSKMNSRGCPINLLHKYK